MTNNIKKISPSWFIYIRILVYFCSKMQTVGVQNRTILNYLKNLIFSRVSKQLNCQ